MPTSRTIGGDDSFVPSTDPVDGVMPGLGDLPEPLPLRRVLGPSLVLLAVSIGSGELVLWPFVSSRAGLGLLWVALVGLVTHYFVNMEIERYTLATGETAITGFTRMWKPWAPIFILFVALSWVWPAWASGASTIAGFVFGWQPGTVATVSVLGLVAIGVSLSISTSVYGVVERIQWVLVAWIVAFAVVAVLLVTDGETWSSMVTDLGFQLHPDLQPALILGLLVFAGAGGTLNLTLSNWIRDKGMGMGAHLGPIQSPLTARPSQGVPLGRPFRDDEENMRRWREWWKVANQEHFIFFFLLGFALIAMFSALSASTVFGRDLGQGFDFIRAEGQALGAMVGPWFRNLFWISGAAILFATNLGILDHMGRLVADILKVNWLSDSETWSESKLYLAVVWVEIVAGSVILLLAFDAPLTLLTIAGAVSGLVMFVYSALLIRLNRTAIPPAIRLRGVRLWAMVWAVLLFAGFSFYLIWTGLGSMVSGVGASG